MRSRIGKEPAFRKRAIANCHIRFSVCAAAVCCSLARGRCGRFYMSCLTACRCRCCLCSIDESSFVPVRNVTSSSLNVGRDCTF
jgi:hypothetical protein